jgi:hypothetical protein
MSASKVKTLRFFNLKVGLGMQSSVPPRLAPHLNTNKIEVGDDKFETKMVTTAVKLASKFLNKMQEHIDNNSIPKDVPVFAKSFFVEAPRGGLHPCTKD